MGEGGQVNLQPLAAPASGSVAAAITDDLDDLWGHRTVLTKGPKTKRRRLENGNEELGCQLMNFPFPLVRKLNSLAWQEKQIC